jgi:hypothetical protein
LKNRRIIFGKTNGIDPPQGAWAMTIFDPSEKVEFIAMQNFKYDNYAGYNYYLERVDVKGKCGLVCVEEHENCATHSTVLLQPIYKDIKVCKISTAKANYDKYVVFANGTRIGEFTMVLNEWIPQCNN